MGSVTADNRTLIPAKNKAGQLVDRFSALTRTPYIEVGYGIDNIFEVLRVDAIQRLTYRGTSGNTGILITPFAIKLSGGLAF